jgi:predicted ester cyclase
MSAEENKALVRRFFDEGFSQGNVAVLDELFTPDCIYHLNTGVVIQGTDEAKTAIVGTRSMNPDLYYTVEEQMVDGDRIAARLTYGGTYQGGSDAFPESAIGKRFTASALFMAHIVDGKIAEAWHSTDRLSHFRQLDMTLAPVPSSPV